MNSKSFAISALLLSGICMTAGSVAAQDNICPYKVGDSRQNGGYPEVDSSCVSVTPNGPNSTRIAVQVRGSQIPTRDTDPTCTDLGLEVICRRICGDLPPGKQPAGVTAKSITPPDYARFEDHLEVFDKGNHRRVCLRVKNWGKGTLKMFAYEVAHVVPPEWPKTYTVVLNDSLSRIAERTYGRQIWQKVYKANREKIRKTPDLIHPGQVFTLIQ